MIEPACLLFYFSRFAEVLGAVGLTSAGETVIFGVAGNPGDLVEHPVAAQHAEMAVMISPAPAFCLTFHEESAFHFEIKSSKSAPNLAENVLKENA